MAGLKAADGRANRRVDNAGRGSRATFIGVLSRDLKMLLMLFREDTFEIS